MAATVGRTDRSSEAVRKKVAEGVLEVHYVLGEKPTACSSTPGGAGGAGRRSARRAATPAPDPARPSQAHAVLAYHDHTVDLLCHEPDGQAPLGDVIASELIIRFPGEIRRRVELPDPRLDDIDDVRPILAVPGWVRSGVAREEPWFLSEVVGKVWRDLVDEFLANPWVRGWMREHHRSLKLDFAQRVKLLLALSARSRPRDRRLTPLYYLLMRGHRRASRGRRSDALEQKEHRGLRFVVNGHTHFAAMTPLGLVNGSQAAFTSTPARGGSSRQLGTVARAGRPF